MFTAGQVARMETHYAVNLQAAIENQTNAVCEPMPNDITESAIPTFFSISDLTPGSYVIRLQYNGAVAVEKLIIDQH
jgi:hypothetical protein